MASALIPAMGLAPSFWPLLPEVLLALAAEPVEEPVDVPYRVHTSNATHKKVSVLLSQLDLSSEKRCLHSPKPWTWTKRKQPR